MTARSSYVTVTDQFCGAGGSSLGAALAGAEVRLAMNHWRLAVETHNTNFPDTLHDCADVSAADPRRYPSTDILITSPECTNHSLAKGARRKNAAQMDLWGRSGIDPAEERSRATMWDVPRFAEHHRYRLIVVENVVDARLWTPFPAWIHAMELLGYDYQVVYCNSMFFHPTPQSRDRMYVVFWRKGNRRPDLDFRPPAFCERCGRDVEAYQSWKNAARPWGKYGRRQQYLYRCPVCRAEVKPYYYAAANAIDWTIPGERIGDRRKPLKPRTMERIRYGLEKFGRQAMSVQTDYSHSRAPRTRPLTDPLPTQTSRQVLALLLPFLVQYYTRQDAASGITDAVPVVTSEPRHALVTPFIVNTAGWLQASSREITEPLPTQVASRVPALVMPFLTSTNYFSERPVAVDEPLPTQATAIKQGITIPPYIVEFWRTGNVRGLEQALGTVTAEGNHHGLVVPFVASYYGGSDVVAAVWDALGAVTTRERHALVEPQPSLAVEDCCFRMLQPHEIGRAMAFPESYVVLGTAKDRVKQYGNAVTPPVMAWLLQRCIETLQ